jgi:drug/metabolite transporter (DMT)-like permease
MIYLLLSIVGSALLFIILKYYDRLGVNTLQAIVVNYITAFSLGIFHNSGSIHTADLPHMSWLWISGILGILFIVVFLLLAKTAQQIGVSVATVANKMSVVIPVGIAIYYYNNSCSALKVAGIVLALAAVVLTSKKEGEKRSFSWSNRLAVLLPLVVFIGSGAIDALLNYAQVRLIPQSDSSIFLASCFGAAGCIGITVVLFRILRYKERPEWKSLAGGIALGIPNYYSTFYFLEALHSHVLESSVLYPLNNLGVVLLCAFAARILFQERLSRINLAGIALSLIAILLIAFS